MTGKRSLDRAGLCCATLLLLCVPSPAASQSGDGGQAAGVLAIPAGGRSAGMGGAYTAGTDVDALFYNPASAAWLERAAAVSYQRHVQDIGFASAAAAARVGPLHGAVTLAFLDFGSIREVRPDPAYEGERGRETGAVLDAAETTVRATAALPLLDGRLAVGASAGLLMVAIAETGRTTPVFDAGAQYRLLPNATIGAALRHAGRSLRGAGLGAAPLPTEVRIGSAVVLPFPPLDHVEISAHADLAIPVRSAGPAPILGVEASFAPANRPFAAALRAGYNGASGTDALGRVHLGGGIQVRHLSLDYAFQDMDLLGSVHRLGIRWAR
ncbi:MAG: hypothetical protein WEF86_04730 [Gemmatimonadota bacterium]